MVEAAERPALYKTRSVRTTLIGSAERLDLDVESFTDALRDHTWAARAADDVDSADPSGVSGTPTFFINGRRQDGAYDIATLSAAARPAYAGGAGYHNHRVSTAHANRRVMAQPAY